LITDVKQLTETMTARVRELGRGCEKAFVAVSGGIDSSTVVALCITTRMSRHKIEPIPGLERSVLLQGGMVD
jgi:NH3-dependent NAD+ synthetase